MRLLKSLVMAFVVVALPVWAGAAFAAEPPETPDQCPEYGCEAELVPLASGGFALIGEARFPMTWYPAPPSRFAKVILDGEVLQIIPILWGSVDYFCCCPTEMKAEYADLLSPIAKVGDELRVVIDSYEVCETVLVVPAGVAPAETPPPPASRGRTRSN